MRKQALDAVGPHQAQSTMTGPASMSITERLALDGGATDRELELRSGTEKKAPTLARQVGQVSIALRDEATLSGA